MTQGRLASPATQSWKPESHGDFRRGAGNWRPGTGALRAGLIAWTCRKQVVEPWLRDH